METLPSKTCSKCKQVKPLSDFNKHPEGKHGAHPRCKDCRKRERAISFEKDIERNRKWVVENRERKRETQRLWGIKNIEKVRVGRRKSLAKTYSTPKGKLTCVMRGAVYRRLYAPGGKGGRTFDLLGYTVEELMASLESKFKPGMSWENHGAWHIDHKRPISSFNFGSANDPEFHECWSLENLQPLWAKENLSKGARYES